MTSYNDEIKIDYKRVIIFLIIATFVSNIFRFNIFHLNEILEKTSKWTYLILEGVLEGSGIFIGALIAIFLLQKKRKTEMSFWGTSVFKSLLMAFVPTVLLIVIGVSNKYEINTHLYGLIAAFGSFIYCIMEEFGWRGYLQEELKGLKQLKRYLLIGFTWYFWHLSFLTKATLTDNLFFLGALILGSWGIGKIAELTKSILACTCFHLIVNIFMYNHFFNNAVSDIGKLIIVAVSILFWILILVKWKKDDVLKEKGIKVGSD
jgi:uncharacterized protein